jgi:hypothetical protein
MAVKPNYYSDLSSCTYQAPANLYFVHYTPPTPSATSLVAQINGVGVDSYFNTTRNNCNRGMTLTFCNNTVCSAVACLLFPVLIISLRQAGFPETLSTDVVTCSRVQEPCTQTRLAALLNAFFFNFWFAFFFYFYI